MEKPSFSRHRLAALALSLAPLVVAPVFAGCMPSIGFAQTSVAKGEAYQSGNGEYDDFFESVAALQRETDSLEAAEKDAREARKSLAETLGLEKVDTEKMAAKVKAKAKKLASQGVVLKLSIDGIDDDGKPIRNKKIGATLDTGGAYVSGKAEELVDSLGKAVEAQSGFLAKYAKFPMQAKKLLEQQAELAPRAVSDFGTMKDRVRVQSELSASKTILEGIADQTERSTTVALALLRDVSAALAANDEVGDGAEQDGADRAEKSDKANEADKKPGKKPEKKPGKKR